MAVKKQESDVSCYLGAYRKGFVHALGIHSGLLPGLNVHAHLRVLPLAGPQDVTGGFFDRCGMIGSREHETGNLRG